MRKKNIISNIDNRILDELVEKISFLIKNGFNDSRKVIFLCGKDKSAKDSTRAKISELLILDKNFQLAYPEDLFEDVLEGQAKNSLLDLETHLADAVDLIVLIPESPGSFAELGAFAMKTELAEKMLVLRQSKYKSDKSFINHGPIRLVRAAKGQILDIPNILNIRDKEHTKPIIDQIKNMLPPGRQKKHIDNILMFHEHILLITYLFDKANANSIKIILSKILARDFTIQDNIGFDAALHSLIRASLIEKSGEVFIITSDGYNDINLKYYSINELNKLRIVIMNKQLCRHKNLIDQ